MRVFSVLGIVAVACPWAVADSCHYNNYATPVVAVPVATILPLYGAGYIGTGGGSDDETKQLLRDLLAEMKALREQMTLTPGIGLPPQAAAAPKIDVFAALKTSCVGCHSGASAKGDFSLTDAKGALRPLSGPERKSILKRLDGVGGDRMPPADKPQLTPDVKAAVKSALSDVGTVPQSLPVIPPAKK